MVKAPKKPEDVKDEPGAEERFSRAIKKALATPPKPHKQLRIERHAQKTAKTGKSGRRRLSSPTGC
jgi:hypothetical protein